MSNRERTSTDIKTFLVSTGITADVIDERIDVLAGAKTYTDLSVEFRARHFTVDEEQFLLPLFRPIYEHIPEVRDAVLTQLAEIGVSRELANRYLVDMGNQPYLILRLSPDVYTTEKSALLDRFIEEARKAMFDTLKKELGIAPITATIPLPSGS